VNLKHGFFTTTAQRNGENIERVDFLPNEEFKSLSSPPKEFRPGPYPELARAQAPEIRGRLVDVAGPNAKFTDAKARESTIQYDHKTGNFVQPGAHSGEHSTKSVIVGGVSSRGGFSGDRSSGEGRSTSSGGGSEARSGGGGSSGAGSSGGGGPPR
jgi:hypothetical protein